jgi:hypothetical protein
MDALCEQDVLRQRERLHSGWSYKRLERGTFAIPADTVGADKLSAASLSTAEVHLLLNGLTPSCPANGLRTQVYVDAT